jgi:hypothetical protein
MNKFDQLCNQILQEQQYTMTGREMLYNRYGKDVADKMIAKIEARGGDNYLEKKYALPDYSQKSLDKIIPIIISNDPEFSRGASGLNKKTIYSHRPDGNEIHINKNLPWFAKNVKNELEGRDFSIADSENMPADVLGHEVTHALQKGSTYKFSNLLQTEIATMLGEIKRWYYHDTGILLDADATDAQINQFINYCEERDVFNSVPYGDRIDFEKLLRTSEGKEVFRRIVKQTPVKSNTMVA